MSDDKTFVTEISSPVGKLTLASDGRNLTGLWIQGQKHFMAGIKNHVPDRNLPVFAEAALWLERYFAGEKPAPFSAGISLTGTPFQLAVWNLLRKIPCGQVISYGKLAAVTAEILGREKMSARAVGAAVGRNPVSIIIPCHRVIGSDGSLTGYAAGTDIKKKLLILEGARFCD